MEDDGYWMIAASKLYAALKSMKLVHAPGCDASKCEVCRQGNEACLEYGALMEPKPKSMYGWSSDPQTDRELQEKYGDSIHRPKS